MPRRSGWPNWSWPRSGSGPARFPQLTLSVSDPYVTLAGPGTQGLPNMGSGAQVTSPPFTLVVSPSCPQARTVELGLLFSANYGVYTTSETFSLMVGLRDLLFVDADDEGTETRITDALASLGRTYVRWNTWESELATVPLDTLRLYSIVLWAAGDQNTSSLTPQNQANLGSYLDAGGNLVLSAENFSTSYGGSSFASAYLHVASFSATTASSVEGTPGDPIGDGVALSLNYHPELSNSPDRVEPGVGATTVFTAGEGADPVVIRYPAAGPSPYRVVFFGVPLEAFTTGVANPHNIETVIDRCLNWMGGDDLAPTPPTGLVLSSEGVLSWSPSTDNVGVTSYWVYRSPQAYFSVEGLVPTLTTTATSVTVTQGLLDPSVDYTYRVTARDAAGNQSAASDPVGEREFALPSLPTSLAEQRSIWPLRSSWLRP